ncbi:hypothetical protein [Streptomyces sp. NPDC002104]
MVRGNANTADAAEKGHALDPDGVAVDHLDRIGVPTLVVGADHHLPLRAPGHFLELLHRVP